MLAVMTSRAWIIRDKEGGGYAMEGENGVWELTGSISRATRFDNEPEAKMTGWAYFPTLLLEIVPVKV